MGIKFQTVSDSLDFEGNFNSVRHHLSCSVYRGAARDHGPKPAPERPSNSQMNIWQVRNCRQPLSGSCTIQSHYSHRLKQRIFFFLTALEKQCGRQYMPGSLSCGNIKTCLLLLPSVGRKLLLIFSGLVFDSSDLDSYLGHLLVMLKCVCMGQN